MCVPISRRDLPHGLTAPADYAPDTSRKFGPDGSSKRAALTRTGKREQQRQVAINAHSFRAARRRGCRFEVAASPVECAIYQYPYTAGRDHPDGALSRYFSLSNDNRASTSVETRPGEYFQYFRAKLTASLSLAAAACCSCVPPCFFPRAIILK